MSRLILSSIGLVLATLVCPAAARAYPWMIKHGYSSCQNCHADPSGGELLTRYGRIQGQVLLPMQYSSAAAAEPASRPARNMDFDAFDDLGDEAETPAAPVPTAPSPEDEPSSGILWGLWDPPEPLLLSGSFELTVNGVIHRLQPGQMLHIAPHEPHSARALTACVVLDVFHPPRDDYR